MCCDFTSRAPPHPCTAVFQSNQNGSLCQSTNLHEQTVLQNPRLHQNSCQGYNNYADDCTRQHRCYSLKMLCALIIPPSSPAPQTTDPYGVSLTLSFPKYLLQSSLQDVPEIQTIPKLTDAQIFDTAHTCGVSLCNLSMALIFFFHFSFCDRVSLCSPGQPWRSSCLSLLSAGITGVCPKLSSIYFKRISRLVITLHKCYAILTRG